MPRFYFNILECGSCADVSGTDLADVATARQEGIRFVGSLLAEEAIRRELGGNWALEITDSADRVVMRPRRQPARLNSAPALNPARPGAALPPGTDGPGKRRGS